MIVDNLYNSKIKLILFFVSLFLYYYKSIFISLEISDEIKNLMSGLFNILLIICFAISLNFFRFKENCLIATLTLLFITNAALYNNIYLFGFIIVVFMLLLSSSIQWDILIKCIVLVHCLAFMLIIPLIFFSESYSYIDERFGVRYTFGFHNPNTFSQYLISFFIALNLLIFTIVKNASLKFFFIVMLTLTVFIIVELTGSRTGMLLTIMTGVGFLLCLFSKNIFLKRRRFVFLYIVSAFILCSLQYYLVATYSSSELSKLLNTYLSGRIWFASLLTNDIWPIPLFHGVNINDYLPIDFFYIAYFYNLGAIVGLWLVYLFTKKLKNQTYTPAMMIALWLSLTITFTENYFAIPLYNIGVFIVFSSRLVNNRYEYSSTYPSPQK